MTLKDSLIDYGLTEKESSVYLATLELGLSTVNTIAKKSNTFRTYCYDILKSLTEKGLITHITKKGVRYFETVDPNKFIDILHTKEEKIRTILPQLKLLKSTAISKPTTEVFEGKEGIKSLHLDILNTKKDHLVIGSTEKIIELLGSWFGYYVKERVKRKISVRVISEDTKFTREKLANSKKEYRNLRLFKEKKIPTTTYIYGDKIAMVSFGKEIFGVITQSKELADTQKIFFESLWKNSVEP